METMVERVAEAMWKKQVLLGDPDEFMELARTAIEAMREPTEAMLTAGCIVGPDTNSGEFDMDNARAVYGAIVGAALTATKAEQPTS